uniref:FBD domain-containing protein n=1 Tax=Setaria italica TaxID=4555 RepID=K3YKX5_SETIT
MLYETRRGCCWEGEVTGEGVPCTRCHNNLKTVYMTGFRCYRAQLELLCGILEKSGPALERVTVEPKVTLRCARVLNMFIPGSQGRS